MDPLFLALQFQGFVTLTARILTFVSYVELRIQLAVCEVQAGRIYSIQTHKEEPPTIKDRPGYMSRLNSKGLASVKDPFSLAQSLLDLPRGKKFRRSAGCPRRAANSWGS